MLGACQTMPGAVGELLGPTRTYQSVDPESLPPISKLAIAAFEMEKQGLLESFPFAKIDPNSRKTNNKTDYAKFVGRNLAIMDFQQNEDGSCVQTMISESVDRYNRIDVSENRLVFSVRAPNEEEVAEMTNSILDSFRDLNTKSKKVREEVKQVFAEYQRASGLAIDGILGRETAESLAREMPILDISEISSTVLYPQKPTAELYVIPYETVDKNVSLFNKGFESLDAVKKHAITGDEFAALATPQQRFVLFLYFFDRVNPELPVRISIAPAERRWSNTFITPIRYVRRGVWPVMIETLCIDERFGSERIYANIYMKYKCIGSFRIK
jgi:hypothetical protein